MVSLVWYLGNYTVCAIIKRERASNMVRFMRKEFYLMGLNPKGSGFGNRTYCLFEVESHYVPLTGLELSM